VASVPSQEFEVGYGVAGPYQFVTGSLVLPVASLAGSAGCKGCAMSKDREALIEAIRCLNDLADVNRAISVAATLTAERLEELQGKLAGMLAPMTHG
jgi:hypothetical protein